MTAPGWYEDYEGSGQLRYHDGERWTDHLHPPATAAAEPASSAPASSEPAAEGPVARVLGVAIIGLLVGVLFGGFIFNVAGTLTPTTESPGTLERIDIEYSADRNRRVGDNERHVLEGTTDTGTAWRIVSRDAYFQVQREGYPQPVTVAMGDWTGAAERVTGETWTVDHQTTAQRIGFGTAVALIALGILAGAWFIFRSASGGPAAVAAFLVSTLVIGNWLGWLMFRWIQSG